MRERGDRRGDGGYPAIEQLYDELLARVWAVRSVSVAMWPDVTSVPFRNELIWAAQEWVEDIETGERSPLELSRVLWPCGPPPLTEDPWWRTPLGRLLAACWPEVAHRADTAAPPSDVVANCVGRGTLVAHSGHASI